MGIQHWTDANAWDEAVARIPRAPFLQSWTWGTFQASLGRRVVRIGFSDGTRLMSGAQFVFLPLPLRHSYVYLPRGPFGDGATFEWEDAIRLLKSEEPRAVFLRTDPPESAPPAPQGSHARLKTVQPQHTLMLDLRKSEAELLSAMHEKTRYNIRLAERKGVQVSHTTEAEQLVDFFALLRETDKRDRIRSHPQAYYQRMFETLAPRGQLALWTARFEGKTLAANLVVSFSDTVTYLHGASSDIARNVMAPHLLQWRQIQDAKQRGFRWYDFWGVAPKDVGSNHAWAGITRFKEGFGGERVSYPAGFDLALTPLRYRAFRLAKTLRRGV